MLVQDFLNYDIALDIPRLGQVAEVVRGESIAQLSLKDCLCLRGYCDVDRNEVVLLGLQNVEELW